MALTGKRPRQVPAVAAQTGCDLPPAGAEGVTDELRWRQRLRREYTTSENF
jgi:hypothetical protein